MNKNKDWDNAFTASNLHGTVEGSPAYDVGEVTALAAAVLASEILCLYTVNPQRQS